MNSDSRFRIHTALLLGMAAAWAAGCGGDKPTGVPAGLSGVVSFMGNALPAATATLTPVRDTPGGRVTLPVKDGLIQADERAGLFVGFYDVRIEPSEPDPDAVEAALQSGRKPATLVEARFRPQNFPAELSAGENLLKFDLRR